MFLLIEEHLAFLVLVVLEINQEKCGVNINTDLNFGSNFSLSLYPCIDTHTHT